MSNEEKSIIEKQMKVIELRGELFRFPQMVKYFDPESDKMLDEKIAVLTAVKEGKEISEIPGFYSIFELLPKDGNWD